MNKIASDAVWAEFFGTLSDSERETCQVALDCILDDRKPANYEYIANARKISKNTVSDHITSLNNKSTAENIGTLIITSRGSGARLSLSEAGHALSDYLRRANRITIPARSSGEPKKVRVAIPASLIMLDSIIRVLQSEPNSQVEIVGNAGEAVSRLKLKLTDAKSLDMAILWGAVPDGHGLPSVRCENAFKMVVVAASDRYFDSKSGKCDADLLALRPLFVPSDYWDAIAPPHAAAKESLDPREIPWNRFSAWVRVDSVEVALALVRANRGLSTVPADYFGLHRLRQTGLACSWSSNPTDVTLIAANSDVCESSLWKALGKTLGKELPSLASCPPDVRPNSEGIEHLALSWAGRKSLFHPNYRLLPLEQERYQGNKYSYFIKATTDPATWYPEVVTFTKSQLHNENDTRIKVGVDLTDWEDNHYTGEGWVVGGTCMTILFSLDMNSARNIDHRSYVAVYNGYYQLGVNNAGEEVGVWLGQWMGVNLVGVSPQMQRPQAQATLLSDVPLTPELIGQLSKINDVFKTMETHLFHPHVGKEEDNKHLKQMLAKAQVTPRTEPPGPAAGRGSS